MTLSYNKMFNKH